MSGELALARQPVARDVHAEGDGGDEPIHDLVGHVPAHELGAQWLRHIAIEFPERIDLEAAVGRLHDSSPRGSEPGR